MRKKLPKKASKKKRKANAQEANNEIEKTFHSVSQTSPINKEGNDMVNPEDSSSTSNATSQNNTAGSNEIIVRLNKQKPWTRAEKISACGIAVSFIAIVIASASFTKTIEAVGIAQKSFEKTSQSVDFNIQAAQRQNRAYLFIDTIRPIELAKDSPILMQFEIGNAGATPAYNVQFVAIPYFRAEEDEVPAEAFFNHVPLPDTGFSTIGSQRTGTYYIDGFIPQKNDIERYLKNEISIFWMIKIKYMDVFMQAHEGRAFFYQKNNEETFIQCSKFNTML